MFKYLLTPLVFGVLGYFCAQQLDASEGLLQACAFAGVCGSICFVVPFIGSGVHNVVEFYGYSMIAGELVWVAVSMAHGS